MDMYTVTHAELLALVGDNTWDNYNSNDKVEDFNLRLLQPHMVGGDLDAYVPQVWWVHRVKNKDDWKLEYAHAYIAMPGPVKHTIHCRPWAMHTEATTRRMHDYPNILQWDAALDLCSVLNKGHEITKTRKLDLIIKQRTQNIADDMIQRMTMDVQWGGPDRSYEEYTTKYDSNGYWF